MAIAIRIEDYTESGLLRARGERVYRKIRGYIESDGVDLSLDGLRSMSRGFADGIILSLVNDGLLDRVTFVTDRESFQEALGRISEIRDVRIYCRSSLESERSVAPKRGGSRSVSVS